MATVARRRIDALDLVSVLEAAEDGADIEAKVGARGRQLGLSDRMPCSKYHFHHLQIPEIASRCMARVDDVW